MNDIDPAKMTDSERTALFASFTQGMTPAQPQRQTLARLLAPWLSAIRTQRDAGYDWKQLAQICTTKLKINVSPTTLERTVRATSRRKVERKKTGLPATSASTSSTTAASRTQPKVASIE